MCKEFLKWKQLNKHSFDNSIFASMRIIISLTMWNPLLAHLWHYPMWGEKWRVSIHITSSKVALIFSNIMSDFLCEKVMKIWLWATSKKYSILVISWCVPKYLFHVNCWFINVFQYHFNAAVFQNSTNSRKKMLYMLTFSIECITRLLKIVYLGYTMLNFPSLFFESKCSWLWQFKKFIWFLWQKSST